MKFEYIIKVPYCCKYYSSRYNSHMTLYKMQMNASAQYSPEVIMNHGSELNTS